MKALVSADWHLSNSLPHAKRSADTLVSDRLRDVQSVLDWVFKAAADRDIPLIVLGDIFDRRKPDAVTLKAAAKMFRGASQLGLKIYILPGNHDAHDSKGLHYVVETFSAVGLDNIRVMEAGVIEELGDGSLFPVPYMSRSAAIELIREYKKQEIKGGVLLLHDTIVGSHLSGSYYADEGIPKDELEGFAYVLAGHIHGFQKLTPVKGVYIGSPYQLNFGEAGYEPSVGMISMSGGKVAFHRIRVPPELCRWFHEVHYDQDGNMTQIGELGSIYFRMIYKGSDEALDVQRSTIELLYREAEGRARSAFFIHRDVPDSAHRRLDIDLMTDGLPSLEKLVGEYVRLHKGKESKRYVQAGLDMLGGHCE